MSVRQSSLAVSGEAGATPAAPRAARLWSDGFSFIGFGLVCVPASGLVSPANWSVLGALCLLGLLLVAFRLRRLLRGGTHILSDVFLTFTISFALFFLFAPLLHVFGPRDMAEFSREWFPVDASDAVFNLGVNLTGFGVVLLFGDLLPMPGFRAHLQTHFAKLPAFDIRKTAMVFLVLGMIFKFLVLKADLDGGTASGLFRLFRLLTPVGVFLYAYRIGFGWRPASFLVVGAAVAYALMGIVEFNKTEFYFPCIALMAGSLGRKLTLPRVLVCAAVMGVVSVILQPLNSDARSEALKRFQPNLRERLDIFSGAMQGEFDLDRPGGFWSRLDYTAPQRAATYLFEHGQGGEDYKNIFWVFVPRFLSGGVKPNLNITGTEFTFKIMGFDTSSTGVGVFFSGYYDLGWLGVLLASCIVGLILAWYRAVMRAGQQVDSVLLVCIGLYGHLTALYISGNYLVTYLGNFVMMLYVVTGTTAALVMLTPKAKAKTEAEA